MCERQHKVPEAVGYRTRGNTGGVRQPPFLWGSVHPISVLELSKNEVDESSMSHRSECEELILYQTYAQPSRMIKLVSLDN